MKNDAIPSFIGGAVLFLAVVWGMISFCRILRRSYTTIRKKEPIGTAEIVRGLIRSDGTILLALSMLHLFTAEEITPYAAAVSLIQAFREMLGVLLLSLFCGYQVHRYNTPQ